VSAPSTGVDVAYWHDSAEHESVFKNARCRVALTEYGPRVNRDILTKMADPQALQKLAPVAPLVS
jgi:hypothetical protein